MRQRILLMDLIFKHLFPTGLFVRFEIQFKFHYSGCLFHPVTWPFDSLHFNYFLFEYSAFTTKTWMTSLMSSSSPHLIYHESKISLGFLLYFSFSSPIILLFAQSTFPPLHFSFNCFPIHSICQCYWQVHF